MKYLLPLLLISTAFVGCNIQRLPTQMAYRHPARKPQQTFPVSNGKLAAHVSGGTDRNTITLSDTTFPINHHDGENCVGTLYIDDMNGGKVSAYQRVLRIDSGIVRDRYTRNGATYAREYFASRPDKVIAIRLKAQPAGTLNSNIILTSPWPHAAKVSQGQITMTGYAPGDPKESVHFCSVVRVSHSGGTMARTDTSLIVTGATEAIVYYVNATSFNGHDKHHVREGAPYIENAMDDAWHLVNFTYDSLLTRHPRDIGERPVSRRQSRRAIGNNQSTTAR
ncbi:MAG: glycoside hydrolase family 95 protein [Prevotella sp.]|nr:glycoside hydrolase family 95 protein [Prevotella sp.]